jgi:hypothetical protein
MAERADEMIGRQMVIAGWPKADGQDPATSSGTSTFNAGLPADLIVRLRWLGLASSRPSPRHSIAVLLKVYGHCIDS